MSFDAYVVCKRVDHAVVYVGITSRGIAKRWRRHIECRFSSGTRLAQALREEGHEAFYVEHVASARTFDELKTLEIELIAQYDTFWPNGYNKTLGGDGVLGNRFSAELLERWSRERKGRLWTEEQKANLAAARAGKPHPFQGRRHKPESIAQMRANFPDRRGEASHWFGRNHSLESRAKISAVQAGKQVSEQTRAKLSGLNHPRFGKSLDPEHAKKIGDAQRGPKNHNFGRTWSSERHAKQKAAIARRRAQLTGQLNDR